MNGAENIAKARLLLVWDWPVRVFHWLLVVTVTALFITGKLGGNWMEWHKRAGFVVIGLITFRLIWGFVGSYHARFTNFVRGPQAIIDYVRGETQDVAGHSPLGALSVIAMLLAFVVQGTTGLFANDDIMLEGPYASMVGKQVSDWLTRVHKLNSNLILGLIGLHLAAIAYYFFRKKTNLIMPMLTGKKVSLEKIPEAEPRGWLALGIIFLVTCAMYFLVYKLPTG